MSLDAILFGLLLSSLGALVLYILYTLLDLRSPLGKIPKAHWSVNISPIWILWTRFRGKELQALVEKHQRFGSILRVGPKDLSVSCYDDGVRTIYNGGFEKPSTYEFFAYYSHKNAFCSMTNQDHSKRRKRMNSAYTKTAIFGSEPLMHITEQILFGRLYPLISSDCDHELPTNVLSISYALSLDLLTGYQFGLESGSNFLLNPCALADWLEDYEKMYYKASFWPQELPILTRWLRLVNINMLPAWQRSARRHLEDWLLDMCQRAEARQLASSQGHPIQTQNIPSVYQIVKTAVEAEMSSATADERKLEIASELFDQMSGGREVLGLVLAYTIYYISRDVTAQERIHEELASMQLGAFQDSRHSDATSTRRLPPPGCMDKLPYLSAVINESLRMRPTSTPLPRITPRDRAVSIAGIDGIPPGTRVNTFQWFIHRDPNKVANPNDWNPNRWLETETEDTKSPKLWAFGGGSRMCVGMSLTYYLMRYIVAVLYSNFGSRVISKRSGVFEPGSLEDKIYIQFHRV